jgi:hypothetical protein
MEIAITQKATETNPVVGDLMLDAYGQPLLVSGIAAQTAQRLFVKFQFFRGEWFLNLDEGTPYYDVILRKGGERFVRSVFGGLIRDDPGVAELLELTYSIDKRTRWLTLQFKAACVDGTILNSLDFGPYVVQV